MSALMRPHRSAEIRPWLDARPSQSLWITAISVYEIVAALRMLPDSRRRRDMERAFSESLSRLFAGRVLPFDLEAAEHAGEILARRLRNGINKDTRDTQVAGIVASRRATLATRNLRDFADLDIPLVDPWSA